MSEISPRPGELQSLLFARFFLFDFFYYCWFKKKIISDGRTGSCAFRWVLEFWCVWLRWLGIWQLRRLMDAASVSYPSSWSWYPCVILTFRLYCRFRFDQSCCFFWLSLIALVSWLSRLSSSYFLDAPCIEKLITSKFYVFFTEEPNLVRNMLC